MRRLPGQPPRGARPREQLRKWVERELRAVLSLGAAAAADAPEAAVAAEGAAAAATRDVGLLSHFVVSLHEGAS